jgi:hypothetical protein
MKEDLTTDDSTGAVGDELDQTSRLANQFTHPGYSFKGQALRPYTAGTDLLFNQVLDRNDAPLTIFLSFIFIHLHERERLFALCWDKLKFRAALFDWIDSLGQLSNEDRTEAMNLFEEIRGWARKSSVEVVDAPEKKTKATRRPRSRAS